ncbi:MAG TPA: hypothetical protein VMF89_25605, partial [Polyangiales bacterium]|nr:hypothetical protein [Polyangiales bacterium]
MGTGRALCRWLLALGCALSLLGSAALTHSARAEDAAERDSEIEVFARVVVETAALRTGPGASFQLVRVAKQGDT